MKETQYEEDFFQAAGEALVEEYLAWYGEGKREREMTDPSETPVLCDHKGCIAVCDDCGQIHSPYWEAAKSAHMHRWGTGHTVTVIRLGKERGAAPPGINRRGRGSRRDRTKG